MKPGEGSLVIHSYYIQPQHNIEPVTKVLNRYMLIDCMNGTSCSFCFLNISLIKHDLV